MGSDFLFAYRFEVHINNKKLGFRSVSGLKITAAFEPLMVGGMNMGPAMLPIPVKDTGRLTMERGVAPSNALGSFQLGRRITDDMQIHIINANGKTGVSYSVAYPILESIEYSKLEATDSSVFIETFTVIHHGISPL